MYDIAIIGGGPAGATLARLIGRRYKVLLLEKRTFQKSSIQKCCGGLLDPDAQNMLASFGLGLPKSVILSPQMFAVRTIDFDNSIERYYQRYYINTDREEFDNWLLSLIPEETTVIKGSIYKCHKEYEDHISISFYKDGKFHEEKTRILIGADGAFSPVRHSSFPESPYPKRYAAIQEWFKSDCKVNYYGAIFDSDVTDFYSWIIPKEEYLIVGSALQSDKNANEKFKLLKEKLKNYGFDLSNSYFKNGTSVLRPLSVKQINTGKGRVGLIGEAAGFISPSSAEGFSYSFKSALALSEALMDGLDDWLGRYKKNTSHITRNIFIKNMKSPFMYNKLLRKVIMKSGVLSIDMKIIFPHI